MSADEATHLRAAMADELEARLAAALRSVRELLRIADAHGFMAAEDQANVRAARALVVEEERRG